MDLTEWEENGQPGAKEYSTPRRGGERGDLYAYRNGNSSREELDDHYDRRRAEVKRAENRFSDSASVISNTVLNHLHSIHRRPVSRVKFFKNFTLNFFNRFFQPELQSTLSNAMSRQRARLSKFGGGRTCCPMSHR